MCSDGFVVSGSDQLGKGKFEAGARSPARRRSERRVYRHSQLMRPRSPGILTGRDADVKIDIAWLLRGSD